MIRTTRGRAALIRLPLILIFALPLMGAGIYEVQDTIDEAAAAIAAAESGVTRYGRYQFYKAQAALTAAQAEYDEMDYGNAACFARKAKKLAEKSTTMQSFTD